MKATTFLLASLLLAATPASTFADSHAAPHKGKILMVAANPAVSPQTGWPVGFWAAELTHPYLELTNAGYQVDIASPEGGKLELDAYSDPEHASGYSADDLISLGFKHSRKHMALIERSLPLRDLKPDDYRAVFFVGGQSPMITFRGNKLVQDTIAAFYSAGKPTAVVCHAVTALLETKLPNGKLLVEGKRWTGFSNAEEDVADQAVGRKLQPYRIEDEARKLKNTKFVVGAPFQPHAIADGNLITGQQQVSGAAAARLVLQQLAPRKKR